MVMNPMTPNDDQVRHSDHDATSGHDASDDARHDDRDRDHDDGGCDDGANVTSESEHVRVRG